MQEWVASRGLRARTFDLAEFPSGTFDLIVNAIGDGVPGKIRLLGASILDTTEHFDALCLGHLERNPACGYVFLSTGRVYGDDYAGANAGDPCALEPEHLKAEPYPLAKRSAELRHRALTDRPIADIRIFGYVSDELGLDDDFLISQMLRATANGETFATTPQDFVRDYVGTEDLVELIGRLLAAGMPNGEYDLFSARPTTKFEMLGTLAREFGLRVRIEGAPMAPAAVPPAISRHGGAAAVGHVPRRTSIENVAAASGAILRNLPDRERRRAP